MKRVWGVVLGLGVLGLLGLAACPQIGLPVIDVKGSVPGSYIVVIQNNKPCPVATIKLVLEVEATQVTALTVNGPAVVSVEGRGRVWTIKLAGAGLKPDPKAYLLVGLVGVTPPVEAKCEALVRYVFPYPPFCP